MAITKAGRQHEQEMERIKKKPNSKRLLTKKRKPMLNERSKNG